MKNKMNLKTIVAVWYTQVCVNIIGLPIYYKTYFKESSVQWNLKNKLGSRFFTLLLTAILFIGCGTTKKTSEETEIKKDSLYNKDKEFTLSTGNFTLKPFDPKKPMIIGKDTIVNTIIENHYRTEVIKEKDNGVIKVDLKQEKQSKEVDYSETIKIIANRFIWLIAIIVIILIAFNWIKNKTTLL